MLVKVVTLFLAIAIFAVLVFYHPPEFLVKKKGRENDGH